MCAYFSSLFGVTFCFTIITDSQRVETFYRVSMCLLPSFLNCHVESYIIIMHHQNQEVDWHGIQSDLTQVSWDFTCTFIFVLCFDRMTNGPPKKKKTLHPNLCDLWIVSYMTKKKLFAVMVNLKILRWWGYPWLSQWTLNALQTSWFWLSHTDFRIVASRTCSKGISFLYFKLQICANFLKQPQETNTNLYV